MAFNPSWAVHTTGSREGQTPGEHESVNDAVGRPGRSPEPADHALQGIESYLMTSPRRSRALPGVGARPAHTRTGSSARVVDFPAVRTPRSSVRTVGDRVS